MMRQEMKHQKIDCKFDQKIDNEIDLGPLFGCEID